MRPHSRDCAAESAVTGGTREQRSDRWTKESDRLFVHASDHAVMIAVTVVRYAAASYPSSIRSSGTTMVASAFASYWPASSIATYRGMSRIGLVPPACPA